MWLLALIRANWRTLLPVAVVLLVIGAFSSWRYNAGFKAGEAAGNAKVAKMYEAGLAAVKKREAQITKNLEVYREELATLRNRRPKRVLFCPTPGVSQSPGGTHGPGADVDSQRDYGFVLRATLDELIRCQALRETLK